MLYQRSAGYMYRRTFALSEVTGGLTCGELPAVARAQEGQFWTFPIHNRFSMSNHALSVKINDSSVRTFRLWLLTVILI